MNRKPALFLCLLIYTVPVLAQQQSVQDLVKQGDKYRDGNGVAKDYVQAMTWFRKAAEQGSPEAQESIGILYDDGKGVPQDFGQAMAWLRKAADQGYADAQFAVGAHYSNGFGVPLDYGQAMTWFRKAADQGHAMAQYIVGQYCEKGRGVPQDFGQAMAWYLKAADQGITGAQFYIGNLYFNGQGVPQDYGQAMIWYRKAADQGNPGAQDNIGSLYQLGQGVPQDYAQAMVWYRRAADQGIAAAQDNIGSLYEKGRGVPQDFGQAMAWYLKAADQGAAKAQINIGNLYENGLGVPRDPTVARSWYQKAANQGNNVAQNAIARLDATASSSLASTAGASKANLQSKINDLKDDAEVNEQAAQTFDQQAQMGGAGAGMATMLAIQKRQKVQSINRQIAELQGQMSSTAVPSFRDASPIAIAPDNAANSASAADAAALSALDNAVQAPPAPAAIRIAAKDTGSGAAGPRATQSALSLVGVWVCQSRWEKSSLIYTDQLTFNADGSFSYNLNGEPPPNNTVWRQNGSSIEIDNLRIPGTQRGSISDSTHASWTMLLDGGLVTYNCERAEAPATTADQRKPATEGANAANTTASYDASPVKAAPIAQLHNECARKINYVRPGLGNDKTPHTFKELKNVCDQPISVMYCVLTSRQCWGCEEESLVPGAVTQGNALTLCHSAGCSDKRIAYNVLLPAAANAHPPTPAVRMCPADSH